MEENLYDEYDDYAGGGGISRSSDPSLRKSPSISATAVSVGTIMEGNDGNQWIVEQDKNGVQRWKKYKGATQPQTQPTTKIKATGMFQPGDEFVIKDEIVNNNNPFDTVTLVINSIDSDIVYYEYYDIKSDSYVKKSLPLDDFRNSVKNGEFIILPVEKYELSKGDYFYSSTYNGTTLFKVSSRVELTFYDYDATEKKLPFPYKKYTPKLISYLLEKGLWRKLKIDSPNTYISKTKTWWTKLEIHSVKNNVFSYTVSNSNHSVSDLVSYEEIAELLLLGNAQKQVTTATKKFKSGDVFIEKNNPEQCYIIDSIINDEIYVNFGVTDPKKYSGFEEKTNMRWSYESNFEADVDNGDVIILDRYHYQSNIPLGDSYYFYINGNFCQVYELNGTSKNYIAIVYVDNDGTLIKKNYPKIAYPPEYVTYLIENGYWQEVVVEKGMNFESRVQVDRYAISVLDVGTTEDEIVSFEKFDLAGKKVNDYTLKKDDFLIELWGINPLMSKPATNTQRIISNIVIGQQFLTKKDIESSSELTDIKVFTFEEVFDNGDVSATYENGRGEGVTVVGKIDDVEQKIQNKEIILVNSVIVGFSFVVGYYFYFKEDLYFIDSETHDYVEIKLATTPNATVTQTVYKDIYRSAILTSLVDNGYIKYLYESDFQVGKKFYSGNSDYMFTYEGIDSEGFIGLRYYSMTQNKDYVGKFTHFQRVMSVLFKYNAAPLDLAKQKLDQRKKQDKENAEEITPIAPAEIKTDNQKIAKFLQDNAQNIGKLGSSNPQLAKIVNDTLSFLSKTFLTGVPTKEGEAKVQEIQKEVIQEVTQEKKPTTLVKVKEITVTKSKRVFVNNKKFSSWQELNKFIEGVYIAWEDDGEKGTVDVKFNVVWENGMEADFTLVIPIYDPFLNEESNFDILRDSETEHIYESVAFSDNLLVTSDIESAVKQVEQDEEETEELTIDIAKQIEELEEELKKATSEEEKENIQQQIDGLNITLNLM